MYLMFLCISKRWTGKEFVVTSFVWKGMEEACQKLVVRIITMICYKKKIWKKII